MFNTIKDIKCETLKDFFFILVEAACSLCGILKGVLDGLGSVDRKVAIGVNNYSGITWYFIKAYFKHGTAGNDVPPKEVKPGKVKVNNRKV